MEGYVKLFVAFFVSIIISIMGWTILTYYQANYYLGLLLDLIGSIVLLIGILFVVKFTFKWIKELWSY